jgi:hypothetical protein
MSSAFRVLQSATSAIANGLVESALDILRIWGCRGHIGPRPSRQAAIPKTSHLASHRLAHVAHVCAVLRLFATVGRTSRVAASPTRANMAYPMAIPQSVGTSGQSAPRYPRGNGCHLNHSSLSLSDFLGRDATARDGRRGNQGGHVDRRH